MRWQRETNYHNSRSYNDEAPRPAVVSQARLTIAWLIDAAQRQFQRLLKPVRRQPTETILLRAGDAHGFTVLGAAIAYHAVHESAITCPFPEQDDAEARRRARRRADLPSSLTRPTNDPFARSADL